jgi:hypothetical protein
VANVAAAAIAVGPAIWVGLARTRERSLLAVAIGAALALAVADVSGLSKAEVERIWLPFLPWLAVTAAAAFTGRPSPERRAWLATQVAWTVIVQWAVRAPW